MERAVGDPNNHVHHREPSDHAVVTSFADAFGSRLDELLRNRTSDRFIQDFDTLTLFIRLKLNDDVSVLTLTAGLPDKLTFTVGRFRDRFAVSNLRLTRCRLHLELTFHPINDDLEMELAHACQNGLTGIGIGLDA